MAICESDSKRVAFFVLHNKEPFVTLPSITRFERMYQYYASPVSFRCNLFMYYELL